MATNSLETPKTTVRFDSIAHLRDELGKRTQDKERLNEFEKTIDEAVKDGEENKIIEFTKDEWESLITKDKLPPIEVQKKLLKEKIEGKNEAKIESKEKREGIMGELDKKVDEAKKAVEDVKEKATGSIKEALSPIEKLKAGIEKAQKSLGEMWSSLWTPVKFAWYTLWASLGFKFGKDALAAMTKEKAEKVVETAKKKVGEVAKVGEEAPKEGKEGVIEKAAPLAILGGAGLGIFAIIQDRLPKSVKDQLSTDKKGFLKKLVGNRALRLFGIGGVTLFGIGKLSETLQDPKIAAELGEMPNDIEGKKIWWKKVIKKAGISVKDGAGEVWSIVNGQKVEEYFEEKGPRPGYQFLEQSNLLKDVKNKINILADKLELVYKKDPTKFNVALASLVAINPKLITGTLGAGVKGIDLTKTIFKALYGSGKNHPLLWSLEIAMMGSQVEAIKHIQVPENMTTESLSETLMGMTDIGEIQEKLTEIAPGMMQADGIQKVTAYLDNNCALLSAEVENFSAHWQDKLDLGMRNLLVAEDREQISRQDKIGLEAFQKELQLELQTNKKGENLETLCGKDMKSGILAEIISKTHREEPLTEGDIHKLIASTEGTHIRIFPEGGTNEGDTLQWVWIDDYGTPEGFAKNICINPLLEENKKVEISRDFVYDQHDLGFAGKLGHEIYKTGYLDLISEMTKAVTAEPGKAKGIAERLLDGGVSFGCFAGKTVVQYMNEVYVLGPSTLFETLIPGGKELTGQEFLIEYAGGLVPVFLISYTNRRLLGRGGGVLGKGGGMFNYKILAETLAYPIKLPADAGMHIYKKIRQGDIAGIFTSPFVHLQEKIYQGIRHLGVMPDSWKNMGNLVHKKEGLLMIHEKVQSANTWKKLGPLGEYRAQKLMDQVSAIIEKRGLNTPEYLEKWKGKIKDLTHTEDILKDIKKSITTAENNIKLHSSKALQDFKIKLESDPGFLNPATDTPKTSAELQKMKELCEKKVQEIETEKQKALTRMKKGTMTDIEWERFKADANRRTISIKGYVRSIEAHIDIRERTGEAGKWRHVGRGILGIAALIGIMAGVQKLRADEPGMEVPELDRENGELNFYGFRAEEDIEKTEIKEMGDKKKESIKDSPEYIQSFLTSLANIKGMYGTEFEFLSDPKALKESNKETIKNKVNNLCNIHGQMIIDIKKLVKDYKEPLKKYFSTLKEKNLYVKESSLNAFFGISEKNGEYMLEYMDADDFSDTIWEMADFNRDNADEILAGKYDGWDQAWYIAKRAAPISGTYMDGKDMVKNFGRGKTGDAFKSMGWMTVGLACDIGMLFSLGGTALPKAAINGSRATLSWARMGKIIEAMRVAKNVMSTGKVGTGFAKTMSFALTHAGTTNMIGMSADVGRQVIVFPRSESINIESL